jgi:hypothetical protein
VADSRMPAYPWLPFQTVITWGAMAILIVSLTTGCSFVRLTITSTIVEADVAFIVPGQTTLQDVVERLGVPDEMLQGPEGATAFYHFRDVTYSRVNFGHLLKPWTPIQPDLVLSTTALGTDVFEVSFDEQGIIRHHAFAHHVSRRSRVPWPF